MSFRFGQLVMILCQNKSNELTVVPQAHPLKMIVSKAGQSQIAPDSNKQSRKMSVFRYLHPQKARVLISNGLIVCSSS